MSSFDIKMQRKIMRDVPAHKLFVFSDGNLGRVIKNQVKILLANIKILFYYLLRSPQ